MVWAVALAACHVGQDYKPDGSVAPDGSTQKPGLNVTWSSNPDIPVDLGNGMTIDSATFKLDTFRVIGDAGDSQTTKSDFDITWSSNGGPSRITFANAPTGLYSRVSIQADGHIIDYSYEIKGTVKLGTTTYDYDIHDRNALNVSLMINKTLQPGGGATVRLQLQLQAAVTAVNWAAFTPDDHSIDFDTFDAQMPAFRTNLLQGFVVDPVDE
ncbi:MAG: hypothetical protein JWO36_1184 [Myxococcales bacterium]|nr:hypothetical protein [Myxococcales bacterium]